MGARGASECDADEYEGEHEHCAEDGLLAQPAREDSDGVVPEQRDAHQRSDDGREQIGRAEQYVEVGSAVWIIADA